MDDELSKSYFRYRVMMSALAVACVVILILLWVFRHQMPPYISWPLAIFVIAFGGDRQLFKEPFISKDAFAELMQSKKRS